MLTLRVKHDTLGLLNTIPALHAHASRGAGTVRFPGYDSAILDGDVLGMVEFRVSLSSIWCERLSVEAIRLGAIFRWGAMLEAQA